MLDLKDDEVAAPAFFAFVLPYGGMLSGTNAHQARFIFRRSARALRIWIW
jgi:cob(I)alamin adenosyltransferase